MTAYVPPKESKDWGQFWRAIVGLASGRSNGTGTVTLAASATTTTVTDENCSSQSVIKLVPATANAAAAVATTYIPLATITNGAFIIQHANNSQVDRTFAYAIQG